MVLEVGQGSCRQMELSEQRHRGVKAKGGVGGDSDPSKHAGHVPGWAGQLHLSLWSQLLPFSTLAGWPG